MIEHILLLSILWTIILNFQYFSMCCQELKYCNAFSLPPVNLSFHSLCKSYIFKVIKVINRGWQLTKRYELNACFDRHINAYVYLCPYEKHLYIQTCTVK